MWIEEGLRALDGDLAARYGPGARIVFRRGPALEALQAVLSAVGAGAVYFNRRQVPAYL